MKLYLIRHGYTVMNDKGIINGQTEDPLTEIGKQQVDLLGQKMQSIPLDMIRSSDMERARHTADAICKYQNSSLTVEQDKRLRERHMWTFEGTLSSDLKRLAAESGMSRSDYYNISDIIEHDDWMISRFKERLNDKVFTGSDLQHVCVVSHGSFIRTIVADILGISGAAYLNACWVIVNASITLLEYLPEKQKRILRTLNDYSHVAHTF